MILYYFDKNNGQIVYGDTDESQIKDLMWDLNDNRLSSINYIFYVIKFIKIIRESRHDF